jgi:hypothetical protein
MSHSFSASQHPEVGAMKKKLSFVSFWAAFVSALVFAPEVDARTGRHPLSERRASDHKVLLIKADRSSNKRSDSPSWGLPINSLQDLGEAVHYFMEESSSED